MTDQSRKRFPCESELRFMAWCVSRDIKPGAEFDYTSADEDTVLGALKEWHPEVKVAVFRHKSLNELFLYRYDHVLKVYEHARSLRETNRDLSNVLQGYVFGIPPHEVERFILEFPKEE